MLSLEIRAESNDVDALRQLQLHYDFEGLGAKREAIHKKLLELDDYDAMIEEAENTAIASEKVADKASKKRLLDKAMALAAKAANDRQVKDISKDSTVQMIQRYLDKLDSKK